MSVEFGLGGSFWDRKGIRFNSRTDLHSQDHLYDRLGVHDEETPLGPPKEKSSSPAPPDKAPQQAQVPSVDENNSIPDDSAY